MSEPRIDLHGHAVGDSVDEEQALSQAPKSAEGRFAVPRILGEAE